MSISRQSSCTADSRLLFWTREALRPQTGLMDNEDRGVALDHQYCPRLNIDLAFMVRIPVMERFSKIQERQYQ